jgi:hypothetical protein
VLIVDGPDIESDLVTWARDWCDLLPADRLAEACARLDEANQDAVAWTPEVITELVQDTFSPDTVFAARHPEGPRFTSPRTARGRERCHVGAFADGSGFWLHYDVPLNGQFSDLTAQFEFHWHGVRILAVRLHDLHVM